MHSTGLSFFFTLTFESPPVALVIASRTELTSKKSGYTEGQAKEMWDNTCAGKYGANTASDLGWLEERKYYALYCHTP